MLVWFTPTTQWIKEKNIHGPRMFLMPSSIGTSSLFTLITSFFCLIDLFANWPICFLIVFSFGKQLIFFLPTGQRDG
ncbi:hypothetical protein F5H01DRAFT_357146 [Linnemannia elongata]|nr:hypothetical protein F5H01DRAFT_357146 [Linnemannia elongata]